MNEPLTNETIVAISTAPGRGGIGVVRLSGAQARQIVTPILRLRHDLAPGRARFGEVVDVATGTVLDEAVVTYFATPHSYTGEDVLEIAAHGSPVLLDYLVRQCCAQGARLAEPGEFTQRAFLAGRIDLTQAEAVGDLIASSTLEQARVAARQLGGALAKVVAPIKTALVELIAAMEAGIDFAEDDVDVMPSHRITAQIAAIRAPLESLERSFAYGRVVRDGFRMAIVGRPNVGKSSLFNRLVERNRAIVTATPGTTRDTVSERVAIDGIPVELIDTAGLREGIDEAERMGIARSHEAMAEADVVLLVVDAMVGISDEDRTVLNGGTGALEQFSCRDREFSDCHSERSEESPHFVRAATLYTLGRTVLVAWNKCDLIANGGEADPSVALRDESRTVRTSALSGEGIAELRAAIVAAVAGPAVRESGMLTNLRQHQAVEKALGGLEAASGAVATGIPHEMALLDLYEALRGLDALTGVTTSEDVLRLIFSRFCIGK
jgi:tRNA modification GTPase